MTTANEHAVVARIEVSDHGVKLVFEDVVGDRQSWTLDALFTSKVFTAGEFLGVTLTARQMEDIGLNLVSRLAVFYAREQGKRSAPD